MSLTLLRVSGNEVVFRSSNKFRVYDITFLPFRKKDGGKYGEQRLH